MTMWDKQLKVSDVAKLTGLHQNSVRCLIKSKLITTIPNMRIVVMSESVLRNELHNILIFKPGERASFYMINLNQLNKAPLTLNTTRIMKILKCSEATVSYLREFCGLNMNPDYNSGGILTIPKKNFENWMDEHRLLKVKPDVSYGIKEAKPTPKPNLIDIMTEKITVKDQPVITAKPENIEVKEMNIDSEVMIFLLRVMPDSCRIDHLRTFHNDIVVAVNEMRKVYK